MDGEKRRNTKRQKMGHRPAMGDDCLSSVESLGRVRHSAIKRLVYFEFGIDYRHDQLMDGFSGIILNRHHHTVVVEW